MLCCTQCSVHNTTGDSRTEYAMYACYAVLNAACQSTRCMHAMLYSMQRVKVRDVCMLCCTQCSVHNTTGDSCTKYAMLACYAVLNAACQSKYAMYACHAVLNAACQSTRCMHAMLYSMQHVKVRDVCMLCCTQCSVHNTTTDVLDQ